MLERKEKGCVKFVLIGLAPYSLHYESTESFSGLCIPRQYEIALALSEDEICQREAVKKLMNHRMQAWADSITEESVDRNNESVKDAFPQQYFSVQDLIGAEQEAEELMANFLMEMGLCVSLKELGVKEGEIAAMVEKISGDISVDPAGGEDGICRKLYIAAL